MVFSSVVFLFYFLPLVLGICFALNHVGRRVGGVRANTIAENLWLLIASLIFYGWAEPRLVPLLLTSCALNYSGGLVLSYLSRGRRAAAGLTVTLNLGLLVSFKYSGLFSAALLRLLALANFPAGPLVHFPSVVLPLGISFYTFHGISYVIDVYRNRVSACRRPLDFACYFVLFPQLVAGPIVRYQQVEGSIRERMLHWTDWCEGFSRFIVGLGKKVLIANQVSIAADAVFALPVDQLTCAAAWTGLMAYGLQIYFDFSGYSDMAIGLGRMMGFSFPENFNYPYWATSMREFWRRWHISLSSWFRDYVYFPLGGNRLGVIRTIANLTLVFALCGLWHGASWNFLIWGLYQGVFLAAERLFGDQPFAGSPVSRCFGRLYTVLAVSFGWVLFRSETFIGASRFFRALMDFSTLGDWASIPWRVLSPDVILPLCAGLVGATPIAILISERIEAGSPGFRIPLTLARGGVLIALLWFALIAVAAGSYNPFIYYRF